MRTLSLGLALLALPVVAQSGGTFVDISSGSDGPPLDPQVYDIAVAPDGSVIAAGAMFQGNGSGADDIGRWDGERWTTVGNTPYPFGPSTYWPFGDINTSAQSVAVAPDGSIYVAGNFDEVDGQPANRIARWDGNEWSALGDGLAFGFAYSVAAGPDGAVYAGSQGFGDVQRWVDEAWTSLPYPDDTYRGVEMLAFSPTGVLYSVTRGGRGHVVLAYESGEWRQIGESFFGDVQDLAFTSDGQIYAVGGFSEVGSQPARGIAVWSGSGWAAMAEAEGAGLVQLYAAEVDERGDLYVGGYFYEQNGATGNGAALWDGSSWKPLGGGVGGSRGGIGVFAARPGGGVYAAGGLQYVFNELPTETSPGEVTYSPGLAEWNGSRWVGRFGSSFDSDVRAIAVHNEVVYVGGRFNFAGPVHSPHIAKRVEGEWHPVGADGEVLGVVSSPSGDLYAGGRFATIAGVSANAVAKMVGETWVPLGDGLRDGDGLAQVSHLALGPGGTTLYAGGRFTHAGAVPVRGVAKWDGSTWAAMGDGPFGDVDCDVTQVAFAPDGSLWASGIVYGSPRTGRVARWDGSNWETIGEDFPFGGNGMHALAISPEGEVFVGGSFSIETENGNYGGGIARWSGEEWEPAGGDTFGTEGAKQGTGDLFFDSRGTLYSGGGIWSNSPRSLYWNDDGQWRLVQRGASGNVRVIVETTEGDLILGGSFGVVDGVVSPRIALYDRPDPVTAEPPTLAEPPALTLAPNPASGATTARVTARGPARVEVFDALGRRVAEPFDGVVTGTTEVPMATAGWSPGVYVVRVMTETGRESVRLVVTR